MKLVLLAAFSWLVFATRREAPAVEPAVPNAFAAAGVGCALMLLSSPLGWVHYYVLLIPLSLYVTQPAADGEAPPLSDGIIAKFLALVPPLMLSDLVQYSLSGSPRALSADFNCASPRWVVSRVRRWNSICSNGGQPHVIGGR